MLNFILNALFWTLALYGLLDIIRKIIYEYIYSGIKKNNTYVIIAVKNGEECIEGSIRTELSKILYTTNPIKEIIVVDLDSNDKTREILNKMKVDNENIKIMNWKECKDVIDETILTNN